MSLHESVLSRGASLPVNLATGGIYGEYNDWLRRQFNVTDESHWFKKGAVDTLAFTTFQVPLYSLVLGFSGADLDEIYDATKNITFY